MKFLRLIFTLVKLLFSKEKLSFPDFAPVPAEPQDGADLDWEETDPDTLYPDEQYWEEPAKEASRFHWIIDPGHGPQSTGKQSSALEDGYIHYEYQFTHEVAAYLVKKLEEAGIDCSLTVQLRPSLGNNLKERTDYARNLDTEKPKRFISIHTNGARLKQGQQWENRESASGTETFIHPNHSPASKTMAEVFQRNVSAYVGKSRKPGIKMANFHVLRETGKIPSILVEVDFHTNKHSVQKMRTSEWRKGLAQVLRDSVINLENHEA